MGSYEFYNECIAELISKHNFNIPLTNPEEFDRWIDDEREKLEEENYFVSNGATRAIIGHPDWSFVFKFPITDDEIDYCANEEFIYSQAEDLGLEKYLAFVEYVGYYYKSPIYAYELCDCNEEEMSSSSYSFHLEACTAEDEDVPEDYDYQEGMFRFAAGHWGEEEAMSLCYLFQQIGVNDCHSGNWGWRANEQLVVVDYAGYGSHAHLIAAAREKATIKKEI